MEISTHEVLGAFTLLAGQRLIEEWVIDLLFPAVTVGTECFQGAPLVVVSNEGTCLPVLAKVARVVVVELWLATKVLPVVRIDALRLVVLTVLEGTPLRLEVEHVEFLVAWVVMDQAGFDLHLRVGKRAELAIGALL